LGRKRKRTGKCFYIFIACLVFTSVGGCAALKETRPGGEGLDTANRLFEHGDYEAALKEYLKVSSNCRNNPPGDEALFYAGLIYAYHGYSRYDYKKSLDCFRRLLRVFPKSPLGGQARMWIAVIQENEKLTLEADELNKSLKRSHSDHERLNREVEELKKTIRKSRQVDIDIDERKKELSK